MNFASKEDLIEFVSQQLGITLSNEDCYCNRLSDVLYTEIPKSHKNEVLKLLDRNGIRHESHHHDWLWIFLINEEGA